MEIKKIFEFCKNYGNSSLNNLDNQLKIYKFIYNNNRYNNLKFQDLREEQRYAIIRRLYDNIFQKKKYLENIDLILNKLDLKLDLEYKNKLEKYLKYLVFSNNEDLAKIALSVDISSKTEQFKIELNKVIARIDKFLIDNNIEI